MLTIRYKASHSPELDLRREGFKGFKGNEGNEEDFELQFDNRRG